MAPIETCVRELLDGLPLPQIEGKQVPLHVLIAIATLLFTHISEHAEFYRALSGKKGWPQLIDCVGVYFDRLMQQHFQWFVRRPGHAEIPLELCITFVNTTGLATIKWWLEHDLTYPPSQVSKWFIQLVRHSLSQLLNVQADENSRETSIRSLIEYPIRGVQYTFIHPFQGDTFLHSLPPPFCTLVEHLVGYGNPNA